MWAAWKSLTDGVAGQVLPFSAQVRHCHAMQVFSPLRRARGDAQPCRRSDNNPMPAMVCFHIFGRTPLVASAVTSLNRVLCPSNALTRASARQSIYELNDLTDISTGNNGTFKAQRGYDLCTGLGVPNAAFTAAWLKRNRVSWSPSPQTVLTA